MVTLKLKSHIDIPLVVDLDGTLTLTDTLHELMVAFFKKNPFVNFFLMMLWLVKGKANLKYEISKKIQIRADLLPYNKKFLEWLYQQRSEGRKLVLCTAASKAVTDQVSQHLPIFEEVLSSSQSENLSGRKKVLALEARYGKAGFVYAGNSSDDLVVWERSCEAVLVNTTENVKNKLKKVISSWIEFPRQKLRLLDFVKLFRIHQWSKNVLIFLPVMAAHQLFEFDNWVSLLIAFIAFGLCASSTYILNDVFDIDSDRTHPTKRNRPFASCDLPIILSLIIFFLAPFSLFVASFVNSSFVLILLLYALITVGYSFYLKYLVIIDCIILAALYTIRIAAGALVIDHHLSFWLMSFSALFFFSLSFLKRYSEIMNYQDTKEDSINGRGYFRSDSPLILSLGVSSGLGSVIVMMLYLNSPEILELYSSPEFVWCSIPVLLFWISYIWFQTQRGNMNDDPVIFAITDRFSIGAAIVFFLCILLGA